MAGDVTEVKGTVVLKDGNEIQFSLTAGLGWQQWGNVPDQLGRTVDLMDAMVEAADEHMVDPNAEDEEEED